MKMKMIVRMRLILMSYNKSKVKSNYSRRWKISHKIIYGLSIDRNPINLMHLSLFTILFTVANTCLSDVGHFDCDTLN